MSKARSRRRKERRAEELTRLPADRSPIPMAEVVRIMTGAAPGETLPPAGVLPEGWPPDDISDEDREFYERQVLTEGWTVSQRPDGSWSVRSPLEWGSFQDDD